MRDGDASKTAEYMALFRALESVRTAHERLFVDPLARGFLSTPLRLLVTIARLRPRLGTRVCRFIDDRWPGARTSGVARTRFIDDRVAEALAAGVRQVVVLGAGFDVRPQRLSAYRGCSVFEVDHPATQARKRKLLAAAGVDGSGVDVRFVPTDFDREQVADTVVAAGYDAGQPTLFLWEGVTNYLTADAVDSTLRWCARGAPGSQLVFTYVDRRVLEHPEAFFGTERLFTRLDDTGERWTFGLDPATVAGYLRERGLALLEDEGAAAYRARYYGASASAMRGYEFYHVARVAIG